MRKVVSLTCIALLLSIVFVQVEADVSAVQYARAEFAVRRQPRHRRPARVASLQPFADNRRPTLTDSSLPPLSTTNTSVMPRMRTQQVPGAQAVLQGVRGEEPLREGAHERGNTATTQPSWYSLTPQVRKPGA